MKDFYKRIRLTVPLLLFHFLSLQSQNIIKGNVVDIESRQPLEGVSIGVSGNTANHTLSDQYGNFSIHSPMDTA